LLQRYKIVNALPKQEEEIKIIAEMMYKRMLDREEEGIVKLRGVIDFATNDDCESG
jgi:DNA-directed RNA polymerase subunit F